ncbi:MAG: ribonuclease D, partial [Actinomycetota bacterium]|nr:ribonuclease D [Actinomycetota bacterium]
MSDPTVPHDTPQPEQPEQPEQPAPEPEKAPLLALREPMPSVVETPEALEAVCEAVAGGTGP